MKAIPHVVAWLVIGFLCLNVINSEAKKTADKVLQDCLNRSDRTGYNCSIELSYYKTVYSLK